MFNSNITHAAACGAAAAAEVARLVAVVDAGVARARRLAIPASAAGSRFPQLCLRKLYVLCSRGAEAGAPQGCLLQARLRAGYFSLYLGQCDRAYALVSQEHGMEWCTRWRFEAGASSGQLPMAAASAVPSHEAYALLLRRRPASLGCLPSVHAIVDAYGAHWGPLPGSSFINLLGTCEQVGEG